MLANNTLLLKTTMVQFWGIQSSSENGRTNILQVDQKLVVVMNTKIYLKTTMESQPTFDSYRTVLH